LDWGQRGFPKGDWDEGGLSFEVSRPCDGKKSQEQGTERLRLEKAGEFDFLVWM
jgi:hypothetical protein